MINKTKNIDLICKKYGITNYTINQDGSIDVNGSVNLSRENLTKLPLKFNRVSGYFDCSNNQLPDNILKSKYRKKILLEGDDFYIWKKGKLDMSSFEYMLDVFKDEE